MNTKQTQSSKKTVAITLDGDARRILVEASGAVSELASATIWATDNGRTRSRS